MTTQPPDAPPVISPATARTAAALIGQLSLQPGAPQFRQAAQEAADALDELRALIAWHAAHNPEPEAEPVE